MHRRNIVSSIVVFLTLILLASAAAKPKLRVAEDGFPTGQDTAEGAASDLARAFMGKDEKLFRGVCIRPYGAGKWRPDYTKYLDGVVTHFREERGIPSPDDPLAIKRVFGARHLSKSGPASYGYAGFDFQDVMFVDVEVQLRSGDAHLRRNLVIKDRDGKWYVLPVPDVDPLLSDGLYGESPSVRLFSDVYGVEK